MELFGLAAEMAGGVIAHLEKDIESGSIEWCGHMKFQGVYLKHLVSKAETEFGLSCHLVKVEPGCFLERHIHKEEWEMHVIITGQGMCQLAGKDRLYQPGRMAVIPKGAPHQVLAGPAGLVILALFFPGLL